MLPAPVPEDIREDWIGGYEETEEEPPEDYLDGA